MVDSKENYKFDLGVQGLNWLACIFLSPYFRIMSWDCLEKYTYLLGKLKGERVRSLNIGHLNSYGKHVLL